ncbi:MAG: hypothetical protein ACLTSX_13505 [Collinsella sp.]
MSSNRAGRLGGEGGVAMGHEGPDAAHLGAELLNEREVGRQPFRRLEGRAHHEAGAHGEPGLAQGGQARHAALKRHDRRVQLRR